MIMKTLWYALRKIGAIVVSTLEKRERVSRSRIRTYMKRNGN
jgi:hypothetical protein